MKFKQLSPRADSQDSRKRQRSNQPKCQGPHWNSAQLHKNCSRSRRFLGHSGMFAACLVFWIWNYKATNLMENPIKHVCCCCINIRQPTRVNLGSDTRPKLAKLPHAVKPEGKQIKSKVTGPCCDAASILLAKTGHLYGWSGWALAHFSTFWIGLELRCCPRELIVMELENRTSKLVCSDTVCKKTWKKLDGKCASRLLYTVYCTSVRVHVHIAWLLVGFCNRNLPPLPIHPSFVCRQKRGQLSLAEHHRYGSRVL